MTFQRLTRAWHLVTLWIAGSVALGFVTWVCFLSGGATELAYLMVVMASTSDSAITSVLLSVIAVVCLNHFFVTPLFSLSTASECDIFALAVFVITSLIIASLVRRVRQFGAVNRERAELFNLTHDTIVVCDICNVIVDWNRGAADLYGWTRHEALGTVASNLLRTEFPVPRDEIMATLLRTGRWGGELVRSARNGTKVTVSSRWALRRDEQGVPIGTLKTNNDITDYRRPRWWTNLAI